MLDQEGYDPAFGARPLKRLIQTKLLDELVMEIIDGNIKENSTVSADLQNSKTVFQTV